MYHIFRTIRPTFLHKNWIQILGSSYVPKETFKYFFGLKRVITIVEKKVIRTVTLTKRVIVPRVEINRILLVKVMLIVNKYFDPKVTLKYIFLKIIL